MSNKRWIPATVLLAWVISTTFLGYGGIRGGLSEEFGLRLRTGAVSAIFGFAFGPGFCLPNGVTLPVALLIAWGIDRTGPARRFQKHRAGTRCCAACGYLAEGLPVERCPECGGGRFVTTRRSILPGWRAIATLVFLGWATGVIVSESWITLDEQTFRREAIARGQSMYTRARWWPNGNASLIYQSGTFRATE